MPQQAGFINWAISKKLNHLGCFMEMRLGKTLACIRLVKKWGCNGACLVVAPITVLEAWEKELRLEGEYFTVVYGMHPDRRLAHIYAAFQKKRRHWILINYDSVRTIPIAASLDWDAVLLDESTAIKNPDARISRLMCTGFREAKHRLILSGLPSPEGEQDLFQQFKFLHGTFMSTSNFHHYRAEYFEAGWNGWQPHPEGKRAIKEMVNKKAFMMRRQDAGINGKKIREVRTIHMSKEQKEAYETVEEEFGIWLQKDEEEILKETTHVIVQQMWLSRIAGGCDSEGVYKWSPKVDELLKLLKGDLSNEPVIVWFRFNSEIRAVEERLKKEGISYKSMMGEHSRKERVDALHWFRTSLDPNRVLLCQVKLAKYGVDASVADTAIYFSMTYSCEEIAQSEERIFHPMKKSPLLYLYLVTKDTVDQDIYYAVSNKVTNSKMFMSRVNESVLRRQLQPAGDVDDEH
jgi:SNF2 family DNA or RNA helicase